MVVRLFLVGSNNMKFWKNNGSWCLYGTDHPVDVAPIQSDSKDIPLEIANEAYKEYKEQFRNDQTLERLNHIGGFGAGELAQLLFDRIKRLEIEGS